MLTRRHIRVKVMQCIYALSQLKDDDLKKQEKFLLLSIDDMYSLYLLQLSLLIEIQKKAKEQLELSKKKYLATSVEKNPDQKFINNKLLLQLVNNSSLLDEIENRKLNDWDLHTDYVNIIYNEILENDTYQKYMASETPSYDDDKALIIALYKTVIAPNEKLYEYLEDVKLTWLDDLPIVNTFILKLFRKAKTSSANQFFLPLLFKDINDKEFALMLLKKTLLHNEALLNEISGKTLNWDKDRIAHLDSILMQMGISEITYFPSIPTKVTMNEYLEIAKEYSTPKSSIFINGILDKLVKEYASENKLNKIGRGLL